MRTRSRTVCTAAAFALQIAVLDFTIPCARAAQSAVQLCCSNITVSPEGAFSTHLMIQPPVASAVTVYGRVTVNYAIDLGVFKTVIAPGQTLSPEILFQDKQLTNGGGVLELTGLAGDPKAALGILITGHLIAPQAVWFPTGAYNTGYISDEGLTEITLFTLEHESPIHVTLRQISGERRDSSGGLLELFTQEIEIPRYQLVVTVQVPNLATAAQFTLESSDNILVDKSVFNAAFPPPTLYFTVQSLYVSAGSTVTLSVHRSGDPFPAVSVDYHTLDDTLKAGIDYVAQSGKLEFAPGEWTKSITIHLLHEPRRRDLGLGFQVVLDNAVNANLSFPNVPIIFARTIDFSSQTFVVDSKGDATLNFSISHPLAESLDVSISFYNPLSHGDFVLEVPAGRTEFSTTLSLPDLQWPLTVGVAGPSSSDIFPGAFSLAEIRPRDWTSDLNLIQVSSFPAWPGDPVDLHLQRLGPANTPLDLMLSTQDGTARAGINYIPTNGVIHFAPGVDSVDFLVATLLNQGAEDEKHFSLSFDNLPPNVRLSGQLTGRIAPANPDFQLSNTALSEGSEMNTVNLVSNSGEISFIYSTIEGTAKAGVDFLPVTGSFNNVTSADIKIPILDDAEVEAPESFTLVIVETSPRRRTNSFEITIFDNEIPFNHDDSFTFSDHYNVTLAGVMKDDRIVIVEWPANIHLLDRNGLRLSTSPIANFFSTNDIFSLLALTPQGELLVASGYWPRVLGKQEPLRIRTDGTLDETFHPDLPFGVVSAILGDDQGRLYVGMNALGSFDWTVLRLNHDGSRDYSFPTIQQPGRGAQVSRLSLTGPDTLEVIAVRYYYRHTDYYRLMVKNGIILEAQNEQDSPFWADPAPFLNGVYVGETGDRIVHQAPPGSYIDILYRRKADGKIDPSLKVGMFDGQPGYIGTQSDGRIIAYDSTANPAGSFVRLGPGTTVSTNLVKIGNFDNGRNEGSDRFEVEVFRLGDSSQRISVSARTQDGTARAGLDYLGIDQTLVFEPYEVAKFVYIPILQDSIVEGDETLFLALGEPALGTMVDGNPFSLTLTDDDYSALQIQMYGNEGYIGVDNRTNRKIELQSSDDGGRTWRKLADPEMFPYLRIDFNAHYRIYRGVVREN